ncbi:hypothetical protein [Ornithinibacillus sp. 179-J 7C1 HS]|uniref:hypothetical protein n=1 Tax=Ornithinibacillus sp. 179-J 7C1 HS TaxID=3142384 RepID=UPI0039A14F0A
MDVWYASYGSNLLKERFLAYIYGGMPLGSDRSEQGARDKTPPKSDERIDMPFPLYFSKNKSKWGKGGVAFIGTDSSPKVNTIGRMYLITEEQFLDVVSQENGGMDMSLNLDEVQEKGFVDIHDGWYNRIVYVGERYGAPIFTFTSSHSLYHVFFTTPSVAYLSVITKGLLEIGLTLNEAIEYLLLKKGIDGEFTRDSLRDYLGWD